MHIVLAWFFYAILLVVRRNAMARGCPARVARRTSRGVAKLHLTLNGTSGGKSSVAVAKCCRPCADCAPCCIGDGAHRTGNSPLFAFASRPSGVVTPTVRPGPQRRLALTTLYEGLRCLK